MIESVNDTLKGQFDLERHGGNTPAGVTVQVRQRILALTAATGRNDTARQFYRPYVPPPRAGRPYRAVGGRRDAGGEKKKGNGRRGRC